MKKNFILWLVVSAIIMLMLPWLAVTFVNGNAGMAVCFVLFFAVNPVYSVIIGASAGRNIKNRWSLPIISATLFLLGAWMFFSIDEMAFVIYAVIYLVLGMLAMLVSMLLCGCPKNRKKFRSNSPE